MKKSAFFLIVALVFGALGFAFAKYCPIGAKLGPQSAKASSAAAPATAGDTHANSSLITQLQTLRGQVELYKLQHNDSAPEFAKYGWKQLTYKTNYKGQISEASKELGMTLYGPYFISPPQNPLTRSSEIFVTSVIPAGFQSTGTFGYVFEESTSRIFGLNADGKIFDESSTAASADAN